jgi:hypothetical protein
MHARGNFCCNLQPVISIYIWSKNFSHSAYEKGEAKMAEIEGAIGRNDWTSMAAILASLFSLTE